MIYIIVFLVSFLILFPTFYHTINPGKDVFMKFITIFFAVFIGLFFSSMGSQTIIQMVTKNEPTFKKVIAQSPIIALKDNSKTTGSLFLGSGNIDSQMYYVFMKEINGGYFMSKHKADDMAVYFDDRPRVVIYQEYYVNPKIKFWTWRDRIDHDKYEIYVPEGTIDQTYNINLE